jgi:hypothetical protein
MHKKSALFSINNANVSAVNIWQTSAFLASYVQLEVIATTANPSEHFSTFAPAKCYH